MTYIVLQLPGNIHYLYDRENSGLFSIEDTDASALKGLLGEEAQQECISRFQAQGLCLPTKLKEIEHPDVHILSQLTAYRVSEMVLQVTQNCNLRCDYCVYSGSYYNRTHSAKRMSKETAFKAVDFLMEHSTDCDSVHIGFYGGEPLLEIELIKKVVEYIENEYEGKHVSYGLTTNATRLTEKTADFMANKGFNLLVSLDGPKEYQNTQRCYVDGKGSYDDVLENLRSLKMRHPDYFDLMRINTVVPPNRDLKRILNFFAENETLARTECLVASVTDVGNKNAIEYDESFTRIILIERTKVILYGLGYLQPESVASSFFVYLSELAYMHKIIINQSLISEKSHPGGPCTPGVRRMFVNVEGKIFPCERIGESSQMEIGSLDDGFNEQRICSMLNIGKLTEKNCKECWAFSLCGQCIALSIDGETISALKRLSRCKEVQGNNFTKLRDLVFLKENGFDFERFEGVRR